MAAGSGPSAGRRTRPRRRSPSRAAARSPATSGLARRPRARAACAVLARAPARVRARAQGRARARGSGAPAPSGRRSASGSGASIVGRVDDGLDWRWATGGSRKRSDLGERLLGRLVAGRRRAAGPRAPRRSAGAPCDSASSSARRAASQASGSRPAPSRTSARRSRVVGRLDRGARGCAATSARPRRRGLVPRAERRGLDRRPRAPPAIRPIRTKIPPIAACGSARSGAIEAASP